MQRHEYAAEMLKLGLMFEYLINRIFEQFGTLAGYSENRIFGKLYLNVQNSQGDQYLALKKVFKFQNDSKIMIVRLFEFKNNDKTRIIRYSNFRIATK